MYSIENSNIKTKALQNSFSFKKNSKLEEIKILIQSRNLKLASNGDFVKIFETENLHPVFQPIVDIRKKSIFGYEALIRGPKDCALETPLALFSAAEELGISSEFELLCRKISIREFSKLKLNRKLFLNISPSELLDPSFTKSKTLQYLKEYEIPPEQVVLEMTEHQKISQYHSLNEALIYYRKMGFKVALDDVGAGYSSLRLWTEVLPDFIKIDMHFVKDIQIDRIKETFIRGLIEISSGSNCKIIAEGVEKVEEYATLQKLGLGLLQGYYFAFPSTRPCSAIEESRFIEEKQSVSIAKRASKSSLYKIIKKTPPIYSSLPIKNVLEMFQENTELHYIPIVNNKEALGIIERHSFFNKLMKSMYGVSLYSKYPIEKFMEESPIVIDRNLDVESISKHITSYSDSEQAFIATDNGEYYGVVTILDLLELITQQKIENARHSNPLTLLPGIVPINNIMDRMLLDGEAFSVLYYDIDSFKPYNDHYGYDLGDNIIKLVARLLLDFYSCETHLIGHIGGDDFIVIDTQDDYESRIKSVLNSFKAKAPDYYNKEHLRDNGIKGVDRSGVETFFDLISLSVGVVPPELSALCESHIEISDMANEAKKNAKKIPGNSYFINRRIKKGI